MSAAPTNPLLQVQYPVPFDAIKPEHLGPAVDQLLLEAQQCIDGVTAETGAPTYDNVLQPLERSTQGLEYAFGIASHLQAVATTDAWREAYNRAQPKITAFFSRLPLDAKLYERVRAFAATPEAEKLEPVRKRLLEKTLREFKRHGAELDPEQKKILEKLDVELAQITTQFAQHVLDATQQFELVVERDDQVKGLPESAKQAAAADAKAHGKSGYRFSLQAPSLIPALTYLEDRNLRETLWRAHNTRATGGQEEGEGVDNTKLLPRIIELRHQKAQLLGYADFTDLTTEERMAKTGANATAFVEDLRARTQTAFQNENESLGAFAQSIGAPTPLAPWDVAHLSEKQRKAEYDFDEEALRPYFPADSVVQGLFETAQRLYGVTFEKDSSAPVWDEAVQVFRMHESGQEQGLFYVDLYPRSNKRDGAWMAGLHTHAEGDTIPHMALFCANITPPAEGKPGLLTHREVETLFHEFGHLMHHMLSTVEVPSLGGTNVAWDFVELPSQIMENWCWNRESLDTFARHHDTGEPIAEQLFQKMTRARTFRAANAQMRQLGFASMDLKLHSQWIAQWLAEPPGKRADVMGFARNVLADHSATALPEDYAMVAGFGHLFADSVGYAAGYYSYKWAEVLDADAFGRFEEEGIFNPQTGRAFREHILSRGNTEDPETLYQNFRGRPATADALQRRQGLQ